MLKRKPKTISQPAWRPNFRITEELPDTKVIRTDFLLNFIFVALALLAGVYLLNIQLQIWSLKSSISAYEEKIAGGDADNKKFLRQSADFEKQSKNIKEVLDFVRAQVPPTNLLESLQNARPEQLILTSVSVSPRSVMQGRNRINYYDITVNGNVIGAAAEATAMVDQFKQNFSETSFIKPILTNSQLVTLTRDQRLGTFSVVLKFELQGTLP